MKKTDFFATICMKNPFKKHGYAYWTGRIYEKDGKGYAHIWGIEYPLSDFYCSPNNSGYVLVHYEPR